VVGIDGSKRALHAASWAVDEVVERDVPLRLVYVIDSRTDDSAVHCTDARLALDYATSSVEVAGHHVEIESEILCGDTAAMLIETSRAAPLVCAGAKGKHDSEPAGPQGLSILRKTNCSVVALRQRQDPSSAQASWNGE
jgi:nucleotide-binding universal stress UspA family protein